MKLSDALFNWLQMQRVCEARPHDNAAKDTLEFFGQILREDHNLDQFMIESMDDTEIRVRYEFGGNVKSQAWDRELCEQLLNDINSNPKYNQ
ncbi:hypothetical protein [Ferviditalea candida]|uniref:Uncharacterized protein n=1 Tax=Ferviditalea candida TaxID=3108399 RepID=A0ABU5ZDT0_9BACL|nr:hypothetical protein [Paenibacillaceae bacterium T2]